MRGLPPTLLAIALLAPPTITSAQSPDRCQAISNAYAARYQALAGRRLEVGRMQPTPTPPGSPAYCALTREMLAVATQWVATMDRCGGEWRSADKRERARHLLATAREQVLVACPRGGYR